MGGEAYGPALAAAAVFPVPAPAAPLRKERRALRGGSRAGALAPEKVWRGVALGDESVFTRPERGNDTELSVDILLDASASQIERQESVSTQAYMIAESLTRCGIPTRVYSFCTLNGCTVLRLFRDYEETSKNEAIFDYCAAGWNRDGLAFRAAG